MVCCSTDKFGAIECSFGCDLPKIILAAIAIALFLFLLLWLESLWEDQEREEGEE